MEFEKFLEKCNEKYENFLKEFDEEYFKELNEKLNEDEMGDFLELIYEFDIISIPSRFREIILEEYKDKYFRELIKKVNCEYNSSIIFPKKENVFEAFKYKDFNEIKVIILGQDPYHNSKAHGLAFSSLDGSETPSLEGIFGALEKDIGNKPDNGNLTSWAKQGVLLLNSTLTVRSGQANSHKNFGWYKFTDKIIKLLSSERENLVFILWGKEAQEKEKLINEDKHKILKSYHPSPKAERNPKLSKEEKFSSCKHFSEANKYLKKYSKGEIDWCELE